MSGSSTARTRAAAERRADRRDLEEIRAPGISAAVRAATSTSPARSSSSWAFRAPASPPWSAACRGWSSRPPGEILFEGRDLLRASPRELIEIRRHKMGMVFQHFALLPHLSVLQNVAFPLEVQGIAAPKREARARR
jgi:glycine betaine/proline transport system ATP-binding protein